MNGLNKKNKIEFSIMLNRIEKVQVSPDDECSDALAGIETFIVSDRDADRKRRHETQRTMIRITEARYIK